MSILSSSHHKPKFNTALASLFLISGVIYFSYHAISGENGLLSLVSLSQQVETARTALDTVRADRLNIEHRVKLMRSESLDLDLLDEQARKRIGYAHKDETVYLLKDGKILGISK